MFEHPSRAWIAAAVMAACALGCAKDSSRANPAEEGRRLRVVVARPAPVEGEQTVELPGTLEPWEDALLYARVTGYLQSVSVDIGSEVKAGDVLAGQSWRRACDHRGPRDGSSASKRTGAARSRACRSRAGVDGREAASGSPKSEPRSDPSTGCRQCGCQDAGGKGSVRPCARRGQATEDTKQLRKAPRTVRWARHPAHPSSWRARPRGHHARRTSDRRSCAHSTASVGASDPRAPGSERRRWLGARCPPRRISRSRV